MGILLKSKLAFVVCFLGDGSTRYVAGLSAFASMRRLQSERRLSALCTGTFLPFVDGSWGRCSNAEATEMISIK